mgnify:CR=1 FL=1
MEAVNAVGKNIIESERAYCAGFIDADGAIMVCIEKHAAKKFGFRVRVSVKITQRDKSVAEWFLKKFGVGRIKANRFGTDRTNFEWEVKDQKVAAEVIEILLPYLQFKKRQALLALRILRTPIRSKAKLQKTARLADRLASFNVRSRLRRKNFASMIQ